LCSSEARLLSAVLTSLSQLSTTRLTDVLPLPNSNSDSASRLITNTVKCPPIVPPVSMVTPAVSMVDDNHRLASSVLGREAAAFPMLVGHMLHQTEMELIGRAHCWTFRDVLDKLLIIAGNPIRHALGQVSCLMLLVSAVVP